MARAHDTPDKPQEIRKHPPQYEGDLNPDHMAGQNIGPHRSTDEGDAELAARVKELTQTFPELTEDELTQIPVLREGARLEQGATYVDLKDPERRPFTARGDMMAGTGSWLVPKSEVPYDLWNRLLGLD